MSNIYKCKCGQEPFFQLFDPAHGKFTLALGHDCGVETIILFIEMQDGAVHMADIEIAKNKIISIWNDKIMKIN